MVSEDKKRSMFIRILGFIINKIWLLFAICIIGIACLFLLLELLLPELNRYKGDIVAFIESKYQIDIEVESISATWSSAGPTILLNNFSIVSENKEFNVFDVGSLSIEFDLLASLINREYSTHIVHLENANLHFFIDKKLGVKLNALSSLKPSTLNENINIGQIERASKRFIELLIAQKKVELVNSRLELKTLSGTSFFYRINNLSILKYENKHQLQGSLYQTGDSGQYNNIKLVAEVHNTNDVEEAYTDLYVEFDKIRLSSIPKLGFAFNAKDTDKDLTASAEVWARWKNRHWIKADAKLKIDTTIPMTANFSWRNDDYHNGYASLHHLRFNENNEAVIEESELSPQVFLKYSHERKEELSWNLLVKEFDITPLMNYLPQVISTDLKVVSWLASNKPSAEIKHTKVTFIKNEFGWQDTDISFEFGDLRVSKMKNIPVLEELNGWFFKNAKQDTIYANLNSELTELTISELFRETIPVDEFNADFQITFDEQNPTINISHLKFSNNDVELNSSAKFYFKNEQPYLGLKAEIIRGNAAKTYRYLPVGIMSDELVDYLDESIISGKLTNTNAVMRGPLSSFPYDNTEGVFIVSAGVDDVNYKYLPDWPLVENVKANLKFESVSMMIDVYSGKSVGNSLNNSKVSIANMLADTSILDLDLDVNSTNNNGRTFLSQTPINFIADAMEMIELNGMFNAKVDLSVPLVESIQDSDIQISGTVHPIDKDTSLNLPFLQANQLDGTIQFDGKGIVKSEMSGLFEKKKVKATIQSIDELDPETGENHFMEIDLEGVFSNKAVDSFVEGQWSSFFEGESEFESTITFSERAFNGSVSNQSKVEKTESVIRVDFETNLKGIAANMPSFLHKQKGEEADFNLSLAFFENDFNDYHIGKLNWNDVEAHWFLDWQDKEPKYSADVFINQKEISQQSDGSRDIKIADKEGINIYGEMELFDLNTWLDFVTQIKSNYVPYYTPLATLLENSEKNKNLNHEADEIENKNVSRWLVNKVDLNIEKLQIPQLKTLVDVKLSADKYKNLPWRVGIHNSSNKLDIIFDKNSQWLINAPEINLEFKTKSADKPQQLENDKAIDSENLGADFKEKYSIYSSIHDMDINCISCMVNQFKLGHIKASVQKMPSDGQVLINAILLNDKAHKMAFNSTWSMEAAKAENTGKEKTDIDEAKEENTGLEFIGSESTGIDFTLSTDNVGKFLEDWGFKASVEDSSGVVVGNFSWESSPWDIDYKKINGSARLDLGKGFLSDISDADGRIITLFNFKSILRKLTFDFKDVYKKGFFFDSIGGSLDVQDGIISTYDTSIKGNVADVWLFGKTDLINQSFDQHVIVSPHITSSFPVLAAWALEPTTGIIVYLLNKMMEPAINVATQIDYRVTGSFDSPNVQEVKKSSRKVKVKTEKEKKVKQTEVSELEQREIDELKNNESDKDGKEGGEKDNKNVEPTMVKSTSLKNELEQEKPVQDKLEHDHSEEIKPIN